MRRTSVFVSIAFLAGLGIGFSFRNAGLETLLRRNTPTADLAAIEKLHKADVEATLTQDPNALTVLWSDDGVNLGFPGPPVVGINAIKEAYEKFRADYPEFRVLKYAPDIKDVQIVDGWAIEWGYTEATYKMSSKDNPVSVPRTEGMRVLKRQSDGSWKFALAGLK
jgi:uncharacterized protein (TIGR02246 family)